MLGLTKLFSCVNIIKQLDIQTILYIKYLYLDRGVSLSITKSKLQGVYDIPQLYNICIKTANKGL